MPVRAMHCEVVRSDGGKLAYYRWPAEGPSLLLIPGSWEDYRQYDALRRHLHHHVNLVIVELPGHGRSWPPASQGSIESFAEDVLRVTEELGWMSWYVGGHSIGGMIAIELAGRRPGEIAGAISVEGWTHHEVLTEAFDGLLYETLSSSQEEQRQRSRSQGRAPLNELERSAFASIWTRWDGEPILRSVTAPILQLWGDRDRPIPSRQKMRIPKRDNIQLRWIAGASHALPLERPQEVATMINAFLRSGSRA